MLILLFWLLVAHSLCDFPLQGDYLSKAKRRGAQPCPWWIALSAHSLIHAGAVAGLTGSIWLGLAEFVVHWVTDYVKCEGHIDFTTDQALHVAWKIVWAVIA